MFGYVVMNKPEIKFKDFDLYRSFYCGLCRELRDRYGVTGQISLTYDMTFVILLLSGLYEPPTRKGTTRCIIHPVRKQPVRKNAITEYAADMNVFLAYYKCEDDWKDEKKLLSLLYGNLLRGKEKHAEERWRKKVDTIVSLLNELSEMEKAGKRISIAFPDVSGRSWRRSLRIGQICGNRHCAGWAFSWVNLFISWMPMMM